MRWRPVAARYAAGLALCASACTDAKERGEAMDEAVPPSAPSVPWSPGVTERSLREAAPRGLLDLRGLIHEHSPYSWDACDQAPREVDGSLSASCLADFRSALCTAGHDFAMLTDHSDSFASEEFPDVLLYDDAAGDSLLVREGAPVGSWMACPGGEPVLLLAGTESALMPVGLDRHASLGGDRAGAYGAQSDAAAQALRDAGAVVLVAHTEEFSAEALATLPIDGFEMYNLHANMTRDLSRAGPILSKLGAPDALMHPDLALLGLVSEDPAYLDTWAAVLASGARRVATMGTDAHQNSLPMLMPDGERVDSYRRLDAWFSNHLLVRYEDSGSFDDRAIESALAAGRLYGVFEYLGFAEGFDFHAVTEGAVVEMGEEAALSAAPVLRVRTPTLRGLDADAESPELVSRILLAERDGWTVVAEGDGVVEHMADRAGAYRAEVRITPLHLREHLNDFASLAETDTVWVYANPIYVAP